MEIEHQRWQMPQWYCLRPEASQMLKWVDENVMKTSNLHSLKVSPHRYFLITKGKTVTLQRGKLAVSSLTKGSELGCGGVEASGASCKFHRGRSITSVVFLPKIHNPTLIINKHQTNSNGRSFCKSNWPVLLKSIKITKETKGLPQIKRDKGEWWLSGTCGPESRPDLGKGCNRSMNEIGIRPAG